MAGTFAVVLLLATIAISAQAYNAAGSEMLLDRVLNAQASDTITPTGPKRSLLTPRTFKSGAVVPNKPKMPPFAANNGDDTPGHRRSLLAPREFKSGVVVPNKPKMPHFAANNGDDTPGHRRSLLAPREFKSGVVVPNKPKMPPFAANNGDDTPGRKKA